MDFVDLVKDHWIPLGAALVGLLTATTKFYFYIRAAIRRERERAEAKSRHLTELKCRYEAFTIRIEMLDSAVCIFRAALDKINRGLPLEEVEGYVCSELGNAQERASSLIANLSVFIGGGVLAASIGAVPMSSVVSGLRWLYDRLYGEEARRRDEFRLRLESAIGKVSAERDPLVAERGECMKELRRLDPTWKCAELPHDYFRTRSAQ